MVFVRVANKRVIAEEWARISKENILVCLFTYSCRAVCKYLLGSGLGRWEEKAEFAK
jgi:hypothetical protein